MIKMSNKQFTAHRFIIISADIYTCNATTIPQAWSRNARQNTTC